MSQTSSSHRNFSIFLSFLVFFGCGDDLYLPKTPSPPKFSSIVFETPQEIRKNEVLSGSYIVTFRAPKETIAHGYRGYLTEAVTQYEWLDAFYLSDPRVKDIRFITTVDLADPRDLNETQDFSAPPLLRLAWEGGEKEELAAAITEVQFQSPAAAEEVLGEWQSDRAIWFAEPNYTSTLYDSPPQASVETSLAPAVIAQQLELEQYNEVVEEIWWHKKIKLVQAMELITKLEIQTLQRPVIAVLDSGVDIAHPGLKDRIWTNPSPGASSCVGDLNGCDTTDATKASLGKGTVMPFTTASYGQPCSSNDENNSVCGHGTHVAGIIAGRVSAAFKAGGVCPVCQILPIRIIKNVEGKGRAIDSAILNGLKYLTLFKSTGSGGLIRVANASFGKSVRSRAVSVLAAVLRRSPYNILIIGAAGNEDTMLRSYPAALNDTVAVAALAQDDAKASYSNFGPWVDVAAPGGDTIPGVNGKIEITATVPGGSYGDKKGTSMAAPVVAGVAGLVLAADPERDTLALRASLVCTANPSIYNPEVRSGLNRNFYYVKPLGESQRLPLLGFGIVDAFAAIEAKKDQLSCSLANARRVDNRCGTVNGKNVSGYMALLVLFVPILLGMIARSRKSTV